MLPRPSIDHEIAKRPYWNTSLQCHQGAELSSATFSATKTAGLITRMQMGDGGTAVYDRGFYNIGVRPTGDDVGVGGTDAFGNPLSVSRREQLNPGSVPGAGVTVAADERVAVDGAFMMQSLRNVELTAPYFHDGSAATLAEVVRFYVKGGNENPNRDWQLEPVPLTEIEQRDVVEFLKALTSDDARRVVEAR